MENAIIIMVIIVKAVYIHIPFCKTLCSYCDFCKMFYNSDWVDKYLNALGKEIETNYKGDMVKTLYVGGGTPSCLSYAQLKKLFTLIKKFKCAAEFEFAFECNINDISSELLDILINNGVNRLSIGIESFNIDNLKILNRCHSYKDVYDKMTLIKNKGIKNINVDLMYAIPGEDIVMLKDDLQKMISLEPTHISTYSLMIENNTLLGVKNVEPIDEDLDYDMYMAINSILTRAGYKQYEISNYAKEGYESKHNLTYWDNEEYYGFGLGASGFIDNIRYDNTKSLNHYLQGNYRMTEEVMTRAKNIENEMILGLRKINGISLEKFKQKYGLDLETFFEIEDLLKEGKLIKNEGRIYISSNNIYTSNDILINFIGEYNE